MDAERIATIRHRAETVHHPLSPLIVELLGALEAAQAEIARLQAVPTVHLHDLPPTWRDGDPEPPPEIHVMGTPECVAGLQAVIAERDRLASQVTDLTTMVQDLLADVGKADEIRALLARLTPTEESS